METRIAGRVPGVPEGRSSYGEYDAYYDLAAAIVHQAVKDYTKLVRKMWEPDLSVAQKRRIVLEKIRLEDFFHSAWYECLTDINPDRLIEQCSILAKNQAKKAIEAKNKRLIKQMLKEQGELQKHQDPQNQKVQNENEGEE